MPGKCHVTIPHGTPGAHTLQMRLHQQAYGVGSERISVQGREKKPEQVLADTPRLLLETGFETAMFTVPVTVEKGRLVVTDFVFPPVEATEKDAIKGMISLYKTIPSIFSKKQFFIIQHIPLTREWLILPASYEQQRAHVKRLKGPYPEKQLTLVEGGEKRSAEQRTEDEKRARTSQLTPAQRKAFLYCATVQGESHDSDDDLNTLLQGLMMEDDIVDISGYF